MKLKVNSLVVVPGTSVTITVDPVLLLNGRHYDMCFFIPCCVDSTFITEYRSIEGNEVVTIVNGTGGPVIPVTTRIGNIFYGDRLFIRREYRFVYGNNTTHFQCENTPKVWPFNPAGHD